MGKSPIYKLKCESFDLAAWEKDMGKYTTFSVKLEKTYRDGDEFKTVGMNFLLNDVPKVVAALTKCHQDLIISKVGESQEF